MATLDGSHQVLSGIVDARYEICKALGVRSPEDDDLVEAIPGLEVASWC